MADHQRQKKEGKKKRSKVSQSSSQQSLGGLDHELQQIGCDSDVVNTVSGERNEDVEATSKTDEAAGSAKADGPALSAAFRRRVRPILDRIDKMRAVGLQRQLKLPMVAVVGDQSVGKSSVLEAISGIELPRGTGIVTRCALQLSLRNKPDSGWLGRISYRSLSGTDVEKTLSEPSEVGDAVREAQNEMTASAGQISMEQINLAIESSTVPDLTLIDLPGIARYSSHCGTEIAAQTKQLIKKYITQPQVIILVVVPCHVDIETVEALSLSKEADEKGDRTIGVMTCPDMVNKGAEPDVMRIAQNQKIPLRKGYVMVRCRNPQELNDKVSLEQSLLNEVEFFKNHEFFSALADGSTGVKTLADKLTEELFESIRRNIPDLQKEIIDLRRQYQLELTELGDEAPQTEEGKVRLMSEMVNKFTSHLTVATSGEMSAEFGLFARCREHWSQLAQEIQDAKPSWVIRHTMQDYWIPPKKVKDYVVNLRGREPPAYDYTFPVVERVFREEFLSILRQPAEDFLESVAKEVGNVIKLAAEKSFSGFDELSMVVVDKSSEELETIQGEAHNDLDRLFKQEARVFTQDKVFELKMQKLEKKLNKDDKNNNNKSPAELKQQDSAERIRRGVDAYLGIASERLADIIPQSVLYFMLEVLAERVTNRSVELISDASEFVGLVTEEPYATARRRDLKNQIEQLRLAQADFNKFRATMKATAA